MNRPLFTSIASRQRGVGLVELMISITIGLVLVALVTSYYLSSRQSYQITVVSSELTDAQRYAMQQIRRLLLSAGYIDSWCDRGDLLPESSDLEGVPNFESGQAIASSSAKEIWIRYAPDIDDDIGEDLDITKLSRCDYEVGNEEVIKEKIFFDEKVLKIKRYMEDPFPLLVGVDALTFTYLDGSGDFKLYNEVEWTSLRAVQVDLLIRSETQTYDTPIQQSFQWPGEKKAKEYKDRYMRSRITRVVTLRNAGEAE